ncbi:VOC family protein [soil metagenome]
MKLKITPCLWFDSQAETAAEFYTSVFPDSRINSVSRYGEAGQEYHGRPPGSVMVVAFELNGQSFTGLNGGPLYQFSEAISFQIECEDQAEIDYYWNKLSEGGAVEAQRCGWLKDKFGLSWQIVPRIFSEIFDGPPTPASQRTMVAIMEMAKIDLVAIERAYAGMESSAK